LPTGVSYWRFFFYNEGVIGSAMRFLERSLRLKNFLPHDQGVDLMPANIEFSGMDISLVNAMNQGKALADLKVYQVYGNRHTDLPGRQSSILDN
jgi:hypothetical protein